MDDSVDWRGRLQMLPVIRRENVKTVMNTLEKYDPGIDEERLLELEKIAQRFEETAYATATSLSHYQEKISSKMLAIETSLIHPLARIEKVEQEIVKLKEEMSAAFQELKDMLSALPARVCDQIKSLMPPMP